MDAVRNPYAPGAGSPPPELAGRHDIIDEATIALKRLSLDRSSQSPILVGLRGVGKTVLLVKIAQIADDEGYKTLSIEAHEGKTLPELIVPGVRKILYALNSIENAKAKAKYGLRVLKSFMNGLRVSIDHFEIGLTIEPEHGVADSGDIETDLPELLLALAEAAKASHTPVAILIDELQYLSSTEFSSLIMAIHKISQRSLPLMLIGAGLPQILGLAGNSKSYAERLFRFPQIGALNDHHAKNAIVNPAREEGVEIEESAVEKIIDVTKSYPYFLQQWSYEAWNIAEENVITSADVDEATHRALRVLDTNFFKVRLDRCTPSEQRYMRAMAELGDGAVRSGEIAEMLDVKVNSVAPVRSKLIKKGMIYAPAHGDTAFTVPLFSQFMKREILQIPD